MKKLLMLALMLGFFANLYLKIYMWATGLNYFFI